MNDSWEDYNRFIPQVSLGQEDIWGPSKLISEILHIWGSTVFNSLLGSFCVFFF